MVDSCQQMLCGFSSHEIMVMVMVYKPRDHGNGQFHSFLANSSKEYNSNIYKFACKLKLKALHVIVFVW